MKTPLPTLLFALAVTLPSAAQTKKKLPVVSDAPAEAAAPSGKFYGDPGWPREIKRDGLSLVLHQPQIDEWAAYRTVKGRMAISLTPVKGNAAVGVVEMEGRTTVNVEQRAVFLTEPKIVSVRFPSLAEPEAKAMEAALRGHFPGRAITMSLDRLLAGVERGKDAAKPVELKMDAPPIFTSAAPAALLIVDGKPVQAPVEGTKLEFVVNTNWDVLFEPETKRYFLLRDKTWLTTEKLEGEWTLATQAPADFAKLPKDWEHLKKVPVKVSKGTALPKILFTDKPAELIEFSGGGTPVLEKVGGTLLLWANNTESWLFQHSGDSQFYFLVSGRWFRAAKLEGPWTYAGNNLPEDFKMIPPTHACSDVLASVPGTPEAEDAVLLAQIPTEAEVKIVEAEAKAKVAYDGEPAFAPVEGVAVSYATNTGSDVIKVENSYYLCQDAVWFVAAAAAGPWKICTAVPKVIYTIPPSCPLHRVTYVYVDAGSSPDMVVCSYTAGYYGAFVAGAATAAVLMWGSGYYYPPYVRWDVDHHHHIYRPCGWSYGVAAVYNPWTGGYAIGQGCYGPYASAGRAAWYNPVTGGYGRIATVQGPYGGRTAAAGYNPRTDTAWATRQGHNGYAQWGTTAVRRGDDWVRAGHIATEEGGVARWKGSEGGGKIKWDDDGASGVARHGDNVYAGKDGNIYRRDEDGWSKYEGSGEWDSVNQPDRPNDKPNPPGQGSPSRPGDKPAARPETKPAPVAPNRPETKPAPVPPKKPAARPSTLPAVESRPATRPAPTQPAPETVNRLDRESTSRDRGSRQTGRAKDLQSRGSSATQNGSRGAATSKRATPSQGKNR